MNKFNSAAFFLLSSLLLMSFLIGGALSLQLMSGFEFCLEWEVISLSGISITMSLIIDMMSVLFFSTVMMISGGVFIYSSSYMMGEVFNSRFCLLVFSFVLSMCLLIFSPNIISILLGWDGLGVTSYLLVCFYSSEKSFNASMLTALTNRLGDVAILILISLMTSLGVFNFGLISSSTFHVGGVAGLLLLVAAMTKSAQVPFSAWLPAAMAAPTPVSALVHSSTLVTAGVYLLIRHNFTLFSHEMGPLTLWLGLITMVMAGGSALFEIDMKKIIALSTLSQLGVMFFSLGLYLPYLTFFHLICHAYFKAMLFMAAGALIHSVKDYQDIRKMGTNLSVFPMLGGVVLIANLSLCGFPFMAGFYSKDAILESMLMSRVGLACFILAALGTGLTVIYSVRLSLGVFMVKARREAFSQEVDMPNLMLFGMGVLLIPSIAGGWFLGGSMSVSSLVFLSGWEKLFILSGVFILAVGFTVAGVSFSPLVRSLRLLHQMWFLPLTLSSINTQVGLSYGKGLFKTGDVTWAQMIWQMGVMISTGQIYIFNLFRLGVLLSLGFILMFVLIS